MRFFQYGNKAALLVGITLMIADSFTAIARQFGAWQVGCMFCVWYSVSAIREDERINKKLKKWFYVYLAIVFVLAIYLHDSAGSQSARVGNSINQSLKALGIKDR